MESDPRWKYESITQIYFKQNSPSAFQKIIIIIINPYVLQINETTK